MPLLIGVAAAVAVLAVVGGGLVARQIVAAGTAGSQPPGPGTAQSSLPAGSATSLVTTQPPRGRRADLTAVLARIRPSVVRVIASTCEGTGVGSGFLLEPDLVVASYSSVAQSVATVVQLGDEVIPARVVGADQRTAVALLRLVRRAGTGLTLSTAVASAQHDVLTVGVPFRHDGVAGVEGTLTDAGRSVDYHGTNIDRLLGLNGSNDRGLAGGPVVDGSGQVVGAVLTLPNTAGRWVVAAERLAAGIDRARTQPVAKATCARPTGPHSDTRISGNAGAKLEKGLLGYFRGINEGNGNAAWRNMGPKYHRAGMSARAFDWTSTYDFDITVHRTWRSGGRQRAWVTFVAINAPKYAPRGLEGQWCARWSFDYEFADGGDRLLIDGNPGHDGATVKMRSC